MTEIPRGPELGDLPEAVGKSGGRRRMQLVWIIPIIAALIGGWLAVKAVLDRGPTITISFRTAEGIEPGKTKIKYKDVDIGEVRSVTLSEDRSGVVVTAELVKQAAGFLVEDTRFWVVRPRIAGGTVSGLGTLLSGAYIAVDAGKSEAGQREFKGLEFPPVLTTGLAGREFLLKAATLGSVGYGTPIYYRRLEVGQVVAYEMDKDGKGFSVRIFVHAPYDRYVTAGSRFWHASGVDVSLGAGGLKVQTESLAAVLIGGVAFGTPEFAFDETPAEAGTAFNLYPDQVEAFKREETRFEVYVLKLQESVRGLQVGAPVDFRGLPMGEVIAVEVDFDKAAKKVFMVVKIRIYPDKLRRRAQKFEPVPTPEMVRRNFDLLVSSGLRGQLRTGNLLTGQLYVAFDFFPKAPKAAIDWNNNPPVLPSMPGGLQELQESVSSIVAKIDKIPFEQLGADLQKAMRSLDETLKTTNALVQKVDAEIAPELKGTLEEAKRTLDSARRVLETDAPVQQDLRDALREVAGAARSLRVLADYIERHPEALIRGKSEEKP
jgi:paraquat-inducible protein B